MEERDAPDPWGATTLELFERLATALADGDAAELAVATVVAVDGSAYRRPGAKMLVDADGTTLGGITAGCLEGPLVDVAADVLAAGEPRIETFDLTDDGDGWGLGLGCEGIVDVLVEPVDECWREPVAAYHDGDPRTLVTALDGAETALGEDLAGARSVVRPDGTVVECNGRAEVPAEILDRVADHARARAEDGSWSRHTVSTADGDVELLVDGVRPADRLLVFGGQPDVRPVTRLAREVGFHVTVATARGAQAEESAFPRADRVVATHPTDLGDVVDERTHVVVMSHNFVDDRLALKALLETDAPYIGLMGPRERFRRLRDDLRDEGVTLSATDRERIASPVGLDLGGGEPVEIALSVVSEALAASNGRAGGRLRDREGPIHDRPATE